MLHKLEVYKYAFLTALFIAVLSMFPGGQTPKVSIEGLDKIIHFIMYFVLMWFLIQANIKQVIIPKLKGRAILISTIVTVLYGVVIEIIQGTVLVGRSFEWFDILANVTGTISGIGAFLAVFGKPEYYIIRRCKSNIEQ
ncbi:VanZ family protein [Salibacter sp.]|uniref:VanZ family protein n=1 Tax=Salibacter sp. TaxID=2010995 RepID=UPI0028705D89|nr:VanZ family protein [Salibacter sp.]MDR9398004.1 VanZ family protein [Salibacter sp.]MDR9486870.1 VanZ family protein [Salibacter sp.]